MKKFTDEQLERYSRHIMLEDVGVQGQSKVSEGKVLIVGVGGLGSSVTLYLAAAGLGKIGIIDGDIVDVTNLQRQVMHFTPDIDLNTSFIVGSLSAAITSAPAIIIAGVQAPQPPMPCRHAACCSLDQRP